MEDFESIRRITTVLGNIDEASAKAGLEPRLVFRPERGDPFRPMNWVGRIEGREVSEVVEMTETALRSFVAAKDAIGHECLTLSSEHIERA